MLIGAPKASNPDFPCFRISLKSLSIQEMLYELLQAIKQRTLPPGIRFGHPNLRKQSANMQHHGVTPGGVLGLSLGCSWSSWALLVLTLCSQLLLDRSWNDCPRNRPPKPEKTACQGVAPWCHTWRCSWALLGSSGCSWALVVSSGCS